MTDDNAEMRRWPQTVWLPWTRLRAIGNSTIVKLTVLIPIVGYMVIFNENILHYLDLSRQIFGKEPLTAYGAHVSWRLLFTYFGLSSLAIGSVIYQLCCPTEIKDHKTATDYIAAARSNMGDVMLGRMESNLRQNSISSEEFLHMQSMAQDRAMAGGLNPKIEADKIYYQYFTDVMDLHFRTLNQSQPFARVSTFIFYATGFIVLAVPSVEVFWRVGVVAIKGVGDA